MADRRHIGAHGSFFPPPPPPQWLLLHQLLSLFSWYHSIRIFWWQHKADKRFLKIFPFLLHSLFSLLSWHLTAENHYRIIKSLNGFDRFQKERILDMNCCCLLYCRVIFQTSIKLFLGGVCFNTFLLQNFFMDNWKENPVSDLSSCLARSKCAPNRRRWVAQWQFALGESPQ